ncbi:MAG: 3-hydroxyacyl-ACP dehydratase FabZ [Nitrospirae bacterium]|nr:3-hydroxyacyl-ACP dehydratase FabZ [Nitrospirota bacterium]
MLDIFEIQKCIPHRYPFLLVDRIIELVPDKSIVGLKNVSINEPFFQGHFPGNPVMPGVLTIEAMAQTAGVLGAKSGIAAKAIYFMSIENAKFRKPVRPGDQLRIEIELTHRRSMVMKFNGKVFVDDQLVSEAQMTAMASDKEI